MSVTQTADIRGSIDISMGGGGGWSVYCSIEDARCMVWVKRVQIYAMYDFK